MKRGDLFRVKRCMLRDDEHVHDDFVPEVGSLIVHVGSEPWCVVSRGEAWSGFQLRFLTSAGLIEFPDRCFVESSLEREG